MSIEKEMIEIADHANLATIATIVRIVKVIDEGLSRPEGVDDREFLQKMRDDLVEIRSNFKDNDSPELKIKRMKIVGSIAESFVEYCNPQTL